MKKREIIISISLIIVLGLLIGLIVYKKHIIDLKNREIEKQKQEEKKKKKRKRKMKKKIKQVEIVAGFAKG